LPAEAVDASANSDAQPTLRVSPPIARCRLGTLAIDRHRGREVLVAPPTAKRIVHGDVAIVPSPSGLPSQHLVTERDGAAALFVGQQWLRPGDRVLLHSHPVEEAITFLAGAGEATLGEERVEIGAGVSLFVPPGIVHGFRCTGPDTLHLIVVFPVPRFAPTTIVEDGSLTSHDSRLPTPGGTA
jgi:quercetin dioxygenase-like cupin family protein